MPFVSASSTSWRHGSWRGGKGPPTTRPQTISTSSSSGLMPGLQAAGAAPLAAPGSVEGFGRSSAAACGLMLAEHGERAGHIDTFNTQGAPAGTQPAAGPFRGGVRPTGAGRSSGQSALSLVESWAGSMGTLREPQSVGVTRQEGLRECTVATFIRTGLSCVVSSHPGAETRDGHLAGAHAAREATRPPAANPAARQMEEIAESAAIGLGPTFFLTRGGIDRSTEGVVAPTRLLELGISSMLDLADAFSEEEEVRSACGAADQTSQDLAVQAWQ